MNGLGTLRVLDTAMTPAQWYLGPLGGMGLTAYSGLSVVNALGGGEDLWVSAAGGAVGALVAQMAVQLANVVDFGLGGAVWSTDEERAIKVAEQLEVGMANVNTPAGEGADLPFGGTKRSGFGRELGPLGIDEFVNKRLFYVEK